MTKKVIIRVSIILAVCVIAILGIIDYRHKDEEVTQANPTETKLAKIPLARVEVTDVTSEPLNCATDLIFCLALNLGEETAIITNYFQSSNDWSSSILATHDLVKYDPINFVSIDNDSISSLTVRHILPDKMVKLNPEWHEYAGKDLINMSNVSKDSKHKAKLAKFNANDSIVIAGYRIEGQVIRFYQIVGKATEMTQFTKSTEDVNISLVKNSRLNDYERPKQAWALRVDSRYAENILGLSGSGVYRWVNGKMTDEIVGIQCMRWVLAMNQDNKVNAEDVLNPSSKSLVFAVFNVIL